MATSAKQPQRGRQPKAKFPKRMGFLNIIATAILLFLLITGIYAQFSEVNESQVPISISEIASDIQAGEVSSLSIRGEEIIVTYADDTTKTVQKEPNVSIIQTSERSRHAGTIFRPIKSQNHIAQ